jgi:hypothetical protein
MERIILNKTANGVLLGLFLSLTTLAQSGHKQSDFYFKDSTTSYEFLEFLGKHFSTDRSKKATFNFFIFKIHGTGKITDINYLGSLHKAEAIKIKNAILKSEPLWTVPKERNAYKWVVIPYYGGTYKEWTGNDLAISSYYRFTELSKLLKSDMQNMYMTSTIGGEGFPQE